jgi:mRNA interferase HigB
MHVISFRRLREFFELHPEAEDPLRRWFKISEKTSWTSFADLRAACPGADLVNHLIVVNIGGNKFRLIVEVFFEDQVVLIRQVLTQNEYDKGEWKRRAPAPRKEATKRGDSVREKAKPKRNGHDGKDQSRG